MNNKLQANNGQKKLFVVLGMHRSGTSAVTRGLQVLGVNLGNQLMSPMIGVNDKGFFEDLEFNSFNIEVLKAIGSDWFYIAPINAVDLEHLRLRGYLLRASELLKRRTSKFDIFAFKDPRVTKLLPFWEEVFAHLQLDVCFIIALRNPLSVVKSLLKRDGLDLEYSYLLWLSYILESIRCSAGRPRIVVDYDRLMEAPDLELMRIGRACDLNIDLTELEIYRNEFLDPDMRHTFYSLNDLVLDAACPPIVRDVYETLSSLASDKISYQDSGLDLKVDYWFQELQKNITALNLIDRQHLNLSSLKQVVAERNAQIDSLKQVVAERDAQSDSLKQVVTERNAQIEILLQSISSQSAQTEQLNKELAQYKSWYNHLRHHNQNLEETLTRVLSSNSLKLTRPLRLMRRNVRLTAGIMRYTRQYMDRHNGFFIGGWKITIRSLEIIRHEGVKEFLQRLSSLSSSAGVRQDDYLKLVPDRTLLVSLGMQVSVNEAKKKSIVTSNLDYLTPRPGYRFWKNYNFQITVDVIVCVHNALDDVRTCLSSLVTYSAPKCNIIIVDDGSNDETRDYLRAFCEDQGASLLRNEIAKGYTLAANQGMRASSAGYIVLLNSDTIVTPGWLEKLVACAQSDNKIGLVGPLSNTASWQSIPKIEEDGDWAKNPLPEGLSILDTSAIVAKYSNQVYPRMSFLNGFCLLLRRELVEEIGFFDEETFGRGYGEENDYCLRARKAGWDLALADDTYVFHAQSKSYSHEKRKKLVDHAGMQLVAKHGSEVITQGVEQCRNDRILISLRARAAANFDRERTISRGRGRWEGRRILFVLPVMHAGGGSNVVITEARAMIRMGVAATLVNVVSHKKAFEESYPDLDVPVDYVESINDIPKIAIGYDAVIATANASVRWIAPLQSVANGPVLGYYVQDFEPLFFTEGSKAYQEAFASYTLIPTIRMFAKTEWNRIEVNNKIGISPTVVGASVDIDLFYPRHQERSTKRNFVHIVALVRPSTPRRNPEGTIAVLARLKDNFGDRVEISIFGAEQNGPEIPMGDAVTSFTNLGQLKPENVANLLSSADLFIDMSHFQAMGLTAMEAMACGVVPVVPKAGGSASFAKHGVNAIIVDTSSVDAVVTVVSALIDDDDRRRAMQQSAIESVTRFYPELAASKILETLLQ